MTMTSDQIQKYVMTYLESTQCNIIEQSSCHVTVKLSPVADKELTNRPYYWGFIERTNTEPETMSFSFVFDSEAYNELENHRMSKVSPQQDISTGTSPQEDSILGRYFGVVRPLPILGPGRIQREDLTFGSPRLKQIFAAARRGGSHVYLFEDINKFTGGITHRIAYEPWLGVCFKVEYSCDMKREELHFLGISLLNGIIDESFQDLLEGKNLHPRLPENIHIEPSGLTLDQGRNALEARLRGMIEQVDHTWAIQANERLDEELLLIDAYYCDLLQESDEQIQATAREQYEARRKEIQWQYEPKINISAINCGLFHLQMDKSLIPQQSKRIR